MESGGRDPVRWALLGVRRGRAHGRRGSAAHRGAGSGHLLRAAAHRPARGWARRAGPTRVRQSGAHRRGAGRPLLRLRARRAYHGVVLARRPRRRAASGLRRPRLDRHAAGRGLPRHRSAHLRGAVPPRGRAHRPGRRDPVQLPLPRREVPTHLDRGGLHRRHGRADPRAGRGRRGDLRSLRRRGLLRGRGARVPGDRRPPDVHLRGPRSPQKARARAGREPVPQPLRHEARRRGRGGPLPRRPGGRGRPRGEAEGDRSPLHRRLRPHGCPGGHGGDVPRAGHAVSRRDRVGVGGRSLGHDQDAPQRRRAARNRCRSS